MRVFLTGATGFIGSAIVPALQAAGHQVTGLARSDASADALRAAGADVHRGSLDDLDSLAAGARAAEGVIHAAFVHDFIHDTSGRSFLELYKAATDTDFHAIQAIGAALAGSGRPLVVTSGTAMMAAGRLATEDDAADPTSAGAHRVRSENAALAFAEEGVRVSVVRLSPSVHGAGDRGGFIPGLVRIAKASGVSGYIGDGTNRWPAVHRSDAAQLFRLALEQAPAGARLHAAAEQGIPLRDIAGAVGDMLGLPVQSIPAGAAAAHFTWLANFAAVDNPTSSALTRQRLGWAPTGPTLLQDIAGGAYAGV